MKGKSTNLILIHFLNDIHKYDFENDLSRTIKEALPKETGFLELDNFSDPVTMSYASDLIKGDNLIIVTAGDTEAPLGKAAGLLNQTIRHPKVTLLALDEIKCIRPFMIRHQGKVIDKRELETILKNH
jgi:hypothetical protein